MSAETFKAFYKNQTIPTVTEVNEPEGSLKSGTEERPGTEVATLSETEPEAGAAEEVPIVDWLKRLADRIGGKREVAAVFISKIEVSLWLVNRDVFLSTAGLRYLAYLLITASSALNQC